MTTERRPCQGFGAATFAHERDGGASSSGGAIVRFGSLVERTGGGTLGRAGVEPGLGESLIHDRPDGRGASSAFRPATEAAVDLGRGAGAVRAGGQAGTHLPIGENVARTDDQGSPAV
jgi:hypothetical protein